jgi:D-alanine transfer protein
LDLLFRTLSELKAQPLILAMPIDGSRYDAQGVSRSARQVYYNKLRKLTQRYQFSLVQFEDHDSDPSFLMAHREHPSPKGWMYYDRALDHFFHQTR